MNGEQVRGAANDILAPGIQKEILFLPRATHGRDVFKEADIRPIAMSGSI